MAIKGYMESTLSQSEVFQGLESNLHIRDKAMYLIKNSKHLTNEDIEAAYIQCKQITDSLTVAALKAFDREETVLVYNTIKKMSMTQAIPFITFKTSGKRTTYVFMDNYVSSPNPGQMNVQPAILRDLLIGAYVSNSIRNNYTGLSNNQYLMKICMEMYDKFFTRVINRLYSVGADKIVFDTIRYWIRRFFLEVVYGATDSIENIDSLAKSHIKYLDEMVINQIKEEYDSASPHDLSGLLDMFKELSPRMHAIGLGQVLNEWINFYHNPFTLGIDNIEYFLFGVESLKNGSPLVNFHAADIVTEQKGIKDLNAELLKI